MSSDEGIFFFFLFFIVLDCDNGIVRQFASVVFTVAALPVL